ncbi:MAG: deoxyhypusine synthase family protein, partial [Candidatus Lokiarchaeota archaeon]|nr:deoxyhypusine synthase family protein [Candidatus Lokiarchaeota archaeon]
MSEKDFKEKLREVEQFKINEDTTIVDLINSLKNTGFNAKRLALACEIYNEMIINKDCVKFFGLAGALVPVGLQRIIYDFIKEGFIDVLVTTGANLTHDLAEALGYHHLQGNIEIDDKDLHSEDINRIYDVFMPNKVYEGIEDFVSKLKISDYQMPVSSFLKFLGNNLPENSYSILRICAEKEIPI